MVSYILTLDKQLLYQICIQLFNTLLLCGLLAWILYKPVLNFLNNRKEKIANQLNGAAQNLSDAEALKAQYEAKLSTIEAERTEILDAARATALQNSQDIIAEAKKEAENIRNRAMTDIQREQEKAKDEIKKQIIEVSTMISGRFVAKSMTETEQNMLLDDTIKDLEGVQWLS